MTDYQRPRAAYWMMRDRKSVTHLIRGDRTVCGHKVIGYDLIYVERAECSGCLIHVTFKGKKARTADPTSEDISAAVAEFKRRGKSIARQPEEKSISWWALYDF